MIYTSDFLTDDSDDIIIDTQDILEEDIVTSTIKNASRRLVGRWDDFLFSNISSGLERFVYQHQTDLTIENIKLAITNSLLQDNLFSPNDFSIKINQNNKSFNIYIKFNKNIDESNIFRIIIDIENQRVYRN